MEENGCEVRKRRIFTEEEWSRINGNLGKREKHVKGDSENGKTRFSLVPLPRRTLKTGKKLEEESRKKRETFPVVEPTGRPLTSDKAKEKIISAAKKILFENKDYARRLLHGLRLSSVLHERNKQIEFNRRLRNMMDAVKNEIKSKMTEEVKIYEEDLKRDKSRKTEIIKMIRMELDKQISQKNEERRREEEDKAREGNEIAKMNEEVKSILRREREEVEMKKVRLKKEIEDYKNSEMEIRKKLKMKEDEQKEVNEIYQKVAWEIDKRRRDKEKDRFTRAIKYDNENFRDGKESLKISSDGDEKLKSFLSMREARKKALLNDFLTGKKMAEEEAERRRNEECSERRKSSVLRRRKVEADRARMLKEREERRKIQSNLRKWYIMQSLEREEMEKEEKEIDKFYAPDFTEENKMIADYCDEVMRFVKRNGRPVFPVAAAVMDVKREFGIETLKNPNFLKSNLPINK